jgi:hypothetical protein
LPGVDVRRIDPSRKGEGFRHPKYRSVGDVDHGVGAVE